MIGKVQSKNTNETISKEKTYKANITQTGTNNPVVVVLKNDLGFEIEWSISGENEFTGTANFKFPPNYTFLHINKPTPETEIKRLNSSEITITTLDGTLTETSIEIAIIEPKGLFSQEFNNTFN